MVMQSLHKSPQVSWPTAGLIVFLCAYVAAVTMTIDSYNLTNTKLLPIVLVGVAILLYMTLVYIGSRLMSRLDVVDVAWSGAFILAVITSFGLNHHGLKIGWNTQTIVAVLVIAWALRLGYHIFCRIQTKPEDKRYVALRKAWKGAPVFNEFFRIFLVQAVLATVVSLVVIFGNTSLPEALNPLVWLGIAFWLIGFGFEVIGDWQLKRFISQPSNHNKLMTSGLWRYTRHPNYFGEAVMWWGIFVMLFASEYGWFGVISPIVITYLLLYVSGVPPAEKLLVKKSGWKSYAAGTSKFFPLPPKKH